MKHALLITVFIFLGTYLMESFNDVCRTKEALTKTDRDSYADYLLTHPYPQDPLEWPEGVA